jgi:amidase
LRFHCTSVAARIAHRKPVRGMSAGWGLDEINANMLLSQTGRIRFGDMVDPKGTVDPKIAGLRQS